MGVVQNEDLSSNDKRKITKNINFIEKDKIEGIFQTKINKSVFTFDENSYKKASESIPLKQKKKYAKTPKH